MNVLRLIGRMIAKAFLVLAAGGGAGLLIYSQALPSANEMLLYDYPTRHAAEERAAMAAIGAGLVASAGCTAVLLMIGWLLGGKPQPLAAPPRPRQPRADRSGEEIPEVKPADQ